MSQFHASKGALSSMQGPSPELSSPINFRTQVPCSCLAVLLHSLSMWWSKRSSQMKGWYDRRGQSSEFGNHWREKQHMSQTVSSYLFWRAHSDGHHWSSVHIIDQATSRSLESLKETWRLLMWAYNCFSSFRAMQLTEYFSRHLKHFLRLIAQRGFWVRASSGCSVISQYKVISGWELCFCKIVGWDESSTLLSCEGTKQPHSSLWIFQGIRILRGRF